MFARQWWQAVESTVPKECSSHRYPDTLTQHSAYQPYYSECARQFTRTIGPYIGQNESNLSEEKSLRQINAEGFFNLLNSELVSRTAAAVAATSTTTAVASTAETATTATAASAIFAGLGLVDV